jgi:DNA-binding NarL/FixJ family response regulator
VLKIVVIEDLRSLREGYRTLIDGTAGFACIGAYRSMEEALDRIGNTAPDAVLVDIGLPGMSGIEGIGILRERYPQTAFLTLTVYEEDERIFDALCAGACGYLLKKTPPARLLESVREAVAGGSPMSPEVARRVVNLFREVRPPQRASYQLTAHEIRLLKLLVEGHNYKTAAAELGITINTVCFHIKQVYSKLQVHSKSEAVAKALRQRLV